MILRLPGTKPPAVASTSDGSTAAPATTPAVGSTETGVVTPSGDRSGTDSPLDLGEEEEGAGWPPMSAAAKSSLQYIGEVSPHDSRK